jgi:hypothetical protein
MFKMLGRVPVKSRLPVEAWLIAAAVTLYSLVSSQLHLPNPSHSPSSRTAANTPRVLE